MNGCGGGGQVKTGFLSDYSKLQKESDSSLRYVNEKAVAGYSGFMVDPVKMVLQSEAKSEGKLTEQQKTDLTNYLHTKIVEAVQGTGKKVAYWVFVFLLNQATQCLMKRWGFGVL